MAFFFAVLIVMSECLSHATKEKWLASIKTSRVL